MKLGRKTRVGGQPAKLVRDLLAHATNSDGFFADLFEEHLFRTWWRATIDELIETGKLDRSNRGYALRLWDDRTQARQDLRSAPAQSTGFYCSDAGPDRSVARARADLRRRPGKRRPHGLSVTDEGHATGMKSLVPS